MTLICFLKDLAFALAFYAVAVPVSVGLAVWVVILFIVQIAASLLTGGRWYPRVA